MAQGKSIIALDVGASGVKIARFVVLKDGSLELLQYSLKDLGIDPHDEDSRMSSMINGVMEAMEDIGVKSGPALVAVSGQSVFSRYVKLPQVSADKIDKIVKYEAAQNVPFPIEEVVWDYQLLDSSGTEQDVLIVAVKKEILEEVTTCVGEAGLDPDLVDVAPMAIYNAVRHNYGDLDGCTLVLDIGARSTNLIFLEAGRIFSRSIPVAGNAITQQIMREFELSFDEADALKKELAVVSPGGPYESMDDAEQQKISKCVRNVMTRMHAEINRSLNFYRGQQGGSSPVRVLLTGGTSVIPNVDTFLAEKLDIEVEYLNPFQTVVVSSTIPEEDIAQHAHLLSEVIGLALRRTPYAKLQLDLLPSEIRRRREFKKKQPLILTGMALCAAAVFAWCGYFVVSKGKLQKNLDEATAAVSMLEQHKSSIDRKQREIKEVKAEIDSLLNLRKDRAAWITAFEEIRRHVPEGAWITRIALEPQAPTRPGASTPATSSAPRGRNDDEEVSPPPVVLDVQGIVYEDIFDKNKNMIQDFERKLKESPMFSPENTAISIAPVRAANDYKRSFWIKVALQDQIPL